MKCNIIKFISIFALLLTTACSKHTDISEAAHSESYLNKVLILSEQKIVNCNGINIILPPTQGRQTLETYIPTIHLENRDKDLATVSIENMQHIYKKCLRPLIIKLVE